jgi:hypothetical protein
MITWATQRFASMLPILSLGGQRHRRSSALVNKLDPRITICSHDQPETLAPSRVRESKDGIPRAVLADKDTGRAKRAAAGLELGFEP